MGTPTVKKITALRAGFAGSDVGPDPSHSSAHAVEVVDGESPCHCGVAELGSLNRRCAPRLLSQQVDAGVISDIRAARS